MKYKLLILDHDDTVVNSTPQVHYPAFMAALKQLRPEVNYTLQEFMSLNFKHGFFGLMTDVLGFNEKELDFQEQVWREYMEYVIPTFFDMMPDLLRRYKSMGGVICVSSHSYDEYIMRDYVANCGIRPDAIFSCSLPEERRKPAPYAIDEAMRRFGVTKEEILVVDDLPTGQKMAAERGVDFAFAGWSRYDAELMDYMCKNAKYVLTEVYELADIVLG